MYATAQLGIIIINMKNLEKGVNQSENQKPGDEQLAVLDHHLTIEEIIQQHVAEEEIYKAKLEQARQKPSDWPSVYANVNGMYMEKYKSGYFPGKFLPRIPYIAGKLGLKATEAYHKRQLNQLRKPREIRAEGIEMVSEALTEEDKTYIGGEISSLFEKLTELHGNSEFSAERERDALQKRIDDLKLYTGLA